MTNMPVPQEQFERDRARLNDLLGTAYTQGQLDLADYRELQDELFSAGSRTELARIGERLPAQYRYGEPAGASNDVSLAPGQVNDPSIRPDGTPAVRASLWFGIGAGVALMVIVVLLVLVLL
jgi:hypothetical protein